MTMSSPAVEARHALVEELCDGRSAFSATPGRIDEDRVLGEELFGEN